MVDSTTGRDTFVVRPEVGDLLDRGELLAHAGMFEGHGFTRNFLWYAPETERVVDGARPWASCRDGANDGGVGAACPAGQVETGAAHTVASTFGG